MALESSARVAVSNAIENKEDLGGMLGRAPDYALCGCMSLYGMTPHDMSWASMLAHSVFLAAQLHMLGFAVRHCTEAQ